MVSAILTSQTVLDKTDSMCTSFWLLSGLKPRPRIEELMSFSVCLLPVMKVSVEVLLRTFYIMMALDFRSVNVTVLICAELMQN